MRSIELESDVFMTNIHPQNIIKVIPIRCLMLSLSLNMKYEIPAKYTELNENRAVIIPWFMVARYAYLKVRIVKIPPKNVIKLSINRVITSVQVSLVWLGIG